MFVSTPLSGPMYWAALDAASLPGGAALHPAHPAHPAAGLYRPPPPPPPGDLHPEPVKPRVLPGGGGAGGGLAAAVPSVASSFFITDILHPSVIPLPGTLPHTPGHATSGPRGTAPPLPPPRAPFSPPSTRAATPPGMRGRRGSSPLGGRGAGYGPTPPGSRGCGLSSTQGSPGPAPSQSPPVRSAQLKFGIDRILQEPRDGPREPVGFRQVKPVVTSPLSGSLPPSVLPITCAPSGLSMLYNPLTYHHHQLLPGHPCGPNHPLASHGYPGHRNPDFPGPFSILSPGDTAPHHPHPTHAHNAPNSHQPKRKRSWSRAVFSNLQRKGLEKRFEVQKYVTKPDRRQLAAMLSLTDAQVKVWFQNRRMKWRHQEERKREDDKRKKETESDSTSAKPPNPTCPRPDLPTQKLKSDLDGATGSGTDRSPDRKCAAGSDTDRSPNGRLSPVSDASCADDGSSVFGHVYDGDVDGEDMDDMDELDDDDDEEELVVDCGSVDVIKSLPGVICRTDDMMTRVSN